jgi:Leucine-rich repeat (LRR) protein
MVIETELKTGMKRSSDEENQDTKRFRPYEDDSLVDITDINTHIYDFTDNNTLKRIRSFSVKNVNNLYRIVLQWSTINSINSESEGNGMCQFFNKMINLEEITLENLSQMSYILLHYLYKNTKLQNIIIKNTNQVNTFNSHNKIYMQQISSLRVLTLTGFKMNMIPTDLYSCSNLEILDLSNNVITSISGDISKLKKLRHLNLSNNSIEYLPKEMNGLTQLESLDISKNKITKIDKLFSSFINLKELNASSCNISSITKTLIFPNIEILKLGKNILKTLPSYFGTFKNLKKLHLERNSFTDLDYMNVEWYNLEELMLHMNVLTNIPVWVYNLINLKSLNLSGNTISYIDPDIKKLKKLESVNFYYNIISSIPIELGQLCELKFLSLKNNMIDEIPLGVFMGMTKLQALYIENNYLVSLPDDILSLGANLKYINYENNPYVNLSQRIKMFIEMVAGQRDNFLYSDNQSVHDRQIQQSFIDSISNLKSMNLEINVNKVFNNWIIDPVLSSECKDEIFRGYMDKTTHVTINMNYRDIFALVWSFMNDPIASGFTSEVVTEIKTIMSKGICDVANMCFTGKTTMLISCLCGFTDKVNIGLNESEELGNMIIAIKRQLIKTGEYSVEKHKENVTKIMKEKGLQDDIIAVWVDNIIEE